MFRYVHLAILGIAATMLLGCGGGSERPSATIQGVVTLEGKPLDQGSVHFTSPKTGESAYANLTGEGKYLVTFPYADIGQAYQVSIGKTVVDETDAHALAANPPAPMTVKIPAKYSERTTSGLSVTIETGGETQYDIAL
ncbi:hypothetical protein LOC68_17110 [Blastopirellula sp. JC732]|uniref:Carboxypeptidase regulatory-like domain-containing protein n=1 Tax=Blastopirellula sediminis TaxID=2894196 RepID=A0A9X1SGE4_9BACT|nr:hypothetical protein [Blastopirellula sediminis]MCC9606587.1 hypothetical protein [Blastopirellula sediminis]MCC9630115.1 hypothetical protein [Blastopirellula sediminis]